MDAEVLIVGQGIAGTMLAYELGKMGVSFMVADKGHKGSSSIAAAGIANPIIGNRFITVSMFPTLKEKAFQSYSQLEKELNIKIIYENPMIRLFYTDADKTRWLNKKSEPGFGKYISNFHKPATLFHNCIPPFVFTDEIKEVFQVDMKALIQSFRERLSRDQLLIEKTVNVEELDIDPKTIKWNGLSFEKIIFCEGAGLRFNPLFKNINFRPSKGQAMLVKFSKTIPAKIIKGKAFIVPIHSGDTHWIGTWNRWDFKSEFPEEEGVKILIERLRQTTDIPFKILSSVSAIRPAIKDRKPAIGSLPGIKNVYCFNGLGTKGASLAPYWAEKTAALISRQTPLPEEVDLKRFFNQITAQ